MSVPKRNLVGSFLKLSWNVLKHVLIRYNTIQCVLLIRPAWCHRGHRNFFALWTISRAVLRRLGWLIVTDSFLAGNRFSFSQRSCLSCILLDWVPLPCTACVGARCKSEKVRELNPRGQHWISHQSVHIFSSSRLTELRFAILIARPTVWPCSAAPPRGRWRRAGAFSQGANMRWSKWKQPREGLSVTGVMQRGQSSAWSILVATGVTGSATCLQGVK